MSPSPMSFQSFENKSETFNTYLAFLVNVLKNGGSQYIGITPQALRSSSPKASWK